jgi:hypothetical protein
VGHGRGKIVSDVSLVIKKLLAHYGAQGMRSCIFGPGRTAPVAVETRDWINSTHDEILTKHIAIS